MKMIKKQLALLTVLALLLSVAVPQMVLGASPWDGYVLTGAKDNGDGIVTLQSSGGATASVSKSQSVGQNYTIEVSVRVEQFSGETGMQISNGTNRLFMMIRNNGISFNGGSTFSYAIGTQWHDYSIQVTGANADVYIDGEYVGKTAIQANTMGGRLYLWAKNSGGAAAIMHISDFIYEENGKLSITSGAGGKAVEQEPTGAYYQDWNNVGDWQLSAPEVQVVSNEDTGKDVHFKSNRNGVVSSALLYYVPTDSFVWSFRLRVDNFNGETGAKMEYGPYRTFCYIRETAIGLRTNSGNINVDADVGHDWHEYRLEVDDGYARFYMDDGLLAEYNIEPYTLDKPVMSFWVKPSGGEPAMTIDWVEYTPLFYNMDLKPLDTSEFLQGDDVVLSAAYTGEEEAPAYVDYKANGTVIGRGYAPDYQFVWENAPYGNYEVQISDDNALSRVSSLRMMRSFGGELVMPEEIKLGEEFSVSTKTYHKLENCAVESVTYMINGNTFVQTNKNENFALHIGQLPLGQYKVQAIVTDNVGEQIAVPEKNVTVKAEQAKGTVVGLEYELQYQSQGDGYIAAGDGMFRLDMKHTTDSITYMTPDGEVTQPLGDGDYRLSVRSGTVELTRNGHFELSFAIPRNDAVSPVDAEGLNNLHVKTQEVRETLVHRTGALEVALADTPELWSLEFEKTGKSPETVEFYDGGFHLQMEMDDHVTVLTAPLGGTVGEKEVLCDVPEGRHIYRITSVRGIAMLYIDNEYAASMRLPSSGKNPLLKRTSAQDGVFTILRSEADIWTFEEDFEDTKTIAPVEYWDGDAQPQILLDENGNCLSVSGGTALLNGFIENPTIFARMKVSGGSNGGVWLVSRHNTDYSKLTIGYNFENQKWEIRRTYRSETKVFGSAEGTIPLDEWFDVKLTVNGESVALAVNGRQVVSADNVTHVSHGKVGVLSEGGSSMKLDNLKVIGDGRISAGMQEQIYTDCRTTDFLELNDGSILMIGAGTTPVYRSTDNGETFSPYNMSTVTSNTIRLQNGNILTITRVNGPETNTYWDYAWISKDEGVSFSGPYQIETRVGNRITMNNKLIQTENGRIILCVGESGHGMEDRGVLGIYYSDDGGVSWKESETTLSIYTTGVNVQEGKVIELPDGTLRCYMRTDHGFICSSDSKDGGVTWDLAVKKTVFPSVLCALNVERDPYEKNTYYMIWEYDNKNESATMQQPRTRVALAVSYDGCETWEYAMDLSGYDLNIDGSRNIMRQMNQGVRVFEDYIYANAIISGATATGDPVSNGYVWRIDKDMIRAQRRFPLPYMLSGQAEEAAAARINYAYIQSKNDNRASVYGELKETPAADGLLISPEMVALYLNATLKNEDGTITLSVGGVDAVFTPGSQEVSINGETYTSEAVGAGAEGIQADAVAKAFGKKLHSDENYIILSTDTKWNESVLQRVQLHFEK